MILTYPGKGHSNIPIMKTDISIMKYVNASNPLTLIYTKTQVTQSTVKWHLSLSEEVRNVLIRSPLLISRGTLGSF